MNPWDKAQQIEQMWWGYCLNTLGEELKQTVYAARMGLRFLECNGIPYQIDMQGKSVLDVGGGPVSLLLKCINVKGKVLDPLPLPTWVKARYQAAGIIYEPTKAENMEEVGWDEVWIYNVLQHVESPQGVISKGLKAGRLIRIFEWLDIPMNPSHLHSLNKDNLDAWLGGEGDVEIFQGERGCWGKAYYGVFPQSEMTL